MRDVVCGKELRDEPYVFSTDYKGDRYTFCSVQCKRTFEAEPQRYARSGLARTMARLVGFFRSPSRDDGGSCC